MAPLALEATHTSLPESKRQPLNLDANDPSTTPELIAEVIERDGGLIVQNLTIKELAQRIKTELKPYFDSDIKHPSGFFAETTQEATGLLGISDACVDDLTTPLLIDTVAPKPQISSTMGFRVNPGGKAQALHRDDGDYHARLEDQPVMIGCIAGISRATAANGATEVIPGSHKWCLERGPKVEEAVPAELEIRDALIIAGHVYHGSGANVTADEVREIIGLFFTKGVYRQAGNQYLMVPPEVAKKSSPQVQRLAIFGAEDEGTVNM
ncbi:PhyH-domain-containing protein [Aspergillus heterothallicus]